uniref:Putative secreted protein n=1 Tax=Anopheles darlingi TaxID=43151 RepID=A0A2M4DH57_ANODA
MSAFLATSFFTSTALVPRQWVTVARTSSSVFSVEMPEMNNQFLRLRTGTNLMELVVGSAVPQISGCVF